MEIKILIDSFTNQSDKLWTTKNETNLSDELTGEKRDQPADSDLESLLGLLLETNSTMPGPAG